MNQCPNESGWSRSRRQIRLIMRYSGRLSNDAIPESRKVVPVLYTSLVRWISMAESLSMPECHVYHRSEALWLRATVFNVPSIATDDHFSQYFLHVTFRAIVSTMPLNIAIQASMQCKCYLWTFRYSSKVMSKPPVIPLPSRLSVTVEDCVRHQACVRSPRNFLCHEQTS